MTRSRLRWNALPHGARLYVAAVIAVGTILFIGSFPREYPRPLLFITLLIAGAVTSTWKVTLPISLSSGSTLSVSYAADLTALLLLGPQLATIVAVAGVVAQCTFHVKQRYPVYRTVLSAAAEGITMGATAVVYQGLGGSIG